MRKWTVLGTIFLLIVSPILIMLCYLGSIAIDAVYVDAFDAYTERLFSEDGTENIPAWSYLPKERFFTPEQIQKVRKSPNIVERLAVGARAVRMMPLEDILAMLSCFKDGMSLTDKQDIAASMLDSYGNPENIFKIFDKRWDKILQTWSEGKAPRKNAAA